MRRAIKPELVFSFSAGFSESQRDTRIRQKSTRTGLEHSRLFSNIREGLRRFEIVRKVNVDWSRTFSTVLEYSRRFEKVRDCEGSLTTMNFCEGSLIRGHSVNPRSANKNKVRGFTNGAE